MPDVIYEMSRKKLGVTAVVEGERLVGDHQRWRFAAAAGEARKRCAGSDGGRVHDGESEDDCGAEFAATALALMEEKKITSLMVVDARRQAAKDRAPARFVEHGTGLELSN